MGKILKGSCNEEKEAAWQMAVQTKVADFIDFEVISILVVYMSSVERFHPSITVVCFDELSID